MNDNVTIADRLSHSEFSAILDQVSEAVCVLDAEARIQFANSRAAAILNGARPEFGALLPGADVILNRDQPFRRAVTAALRDLKPAVFEYHSESIDRLLSVRLAPTESGVLVCFDDLTVKREQELAQEWLLAIAASSNDPIIGLTLDREIVSWNSAAEQVFGYTADEIIGQSAALLAPPELQAEQRGLFEQSRRGEAVVNHETVRMRKDGTRLDVSVTHSAVRTRDRRIVGVSVTMRDITARKRAMQRLVESTQRVNRILETITDGYYAVDSNWQITYVNHKAEELWSKSRQEVLGENLWHIFPSAVGTPLYGIFTQVMRTRQHAQFDHFSDGLQKWFDITVYPNDGGVIVYFRDIGDRKRADQERREIDELYLTLFNSVDEGVCVLEMIFDEHNHPIDYRFLETNQVFEMQTGLENARGKTARELVPDLEAHWFETYGRVALTGEAVRFVNGSESMGRWFDVYACRVGGPESRKVALLFTDITKRKQAEKELTRSRDDLELRVRQRTLELHEMVRVRGELLQRLVTAQESERSRITRELHDQLGQLLTALGLGLSGLRLQGSGSPDFDVQVAKLQALIRRTSETVQSIVYQLRPPALDALGLATTLENYLEEWATEHAIPAQFAFTGDTRVRLPADIETAIYRIVQEALTNILRHARAKNVNLILDFGPERVVAIVEDDGRGLDTDSFSAPKPGARSFGLIGMRERAEMVGGTLEIESQPSVGTTVFIRIPTPAPVLES